MDIETKNRLINRLSICLPSLRKQLGLTQEELGLKVGVSRITINTIEKKREMTWSRFVSIMMVLTSDKEVSNRLKELGIYDKEIDNLFNHTTKPAFSSKQSAPSFAGSRFALVKEFAQYIPSAFAVFTANNGFEILFCNKALYEVTEYKNEEDFKKGTGFSFKKLFLKEDHNDSMRVLLRDIYANDERKVHVNHRMVTKTGKIKWFDTYVQIVDIEGVGSVYFAFLTDITDNYSRKMVNKINAMDETNDRDELIRSLDEVEAMSLLKKNYLGLKVLLADSNLASLDVARRVLEMEGAEVFCVTNGKEAIATAKKYKFDLILVDLMMPIVSGVKVIEEISRNYSARRIGVPIIGLAIDGSDLQIKHALEAGAFECMYKPINIPELSSIILSFSRMKENSMKNELADAVRNANTDALTKVKSSNAYSKRISEINKELKGNPSKEIAIVICDCDNLKAVNDTYGHAVGDTYIINCCKIICEIFAHSPVYRIGGDEFLVILQGKDLTEHQYLMKKLEITIDKTKNLPSVEEGKASISFGMALYDRRIDEDLTNTCRRADAEMYKIKSIHHKEK